VSGFILIIKLAQDEIVRSPTLWLLSPRL